MLCCLAVSVVDMSTTARLIWLPPLTGRSRYELSRSTVLARPNHLPDDLESDPAETRISSAGGSTGTEFG